MPIVNTLKIYEDLKEKLPETQAKVITEVIEKSFEEYKENQKEFLATKEDLIKEVAKLDKRIEEVKSELLQSDAKLDKRIEEVKSELLQSDAKLDNKISQTEARIIKWMFIFWAGQIFALLGILLAFFKK